MSAVQKSLTDKMWDVLEQDNRETFALVEREKDAFKANIINLLAAEKVNYAKKYVTECEKCMEPFFTKETKKSIFKLLEIDENKE